MSCRKQMSIFLNSQELGAESLSLFVQVWFLEWHLTVSHFLSTSLQLDLVFQIKSMKDGHPAYRRSLGRFYTEVFSPSCQCVFGNLPRGPRHHPQSGRPVGVLFCPGDREIHDFWPCVISNSGPGDFSIHHLCFSTSETCLHWNISGAHSNFSSKSSSLVWHYLPPGALSGIASCASIQVPVTRGLWACLIVTP